MAVKQVIQLSLPMFVGANVEDKGSKIIQCDDIPGLREHLLTIMEKSADCPVNSISGKNILTQVALAMGWVKHEFSTAATLITPERRHFFLYFDDQFKDMDDSLLDLIKDTNIASITPGGTAYRVPEKYAAINRKPENLLAKFDLLVKGGIGNLFEYVHIPTEHYVSAVGYSETFVSHRVMDFDINPNQFHSDHPFMFVKEDITKVFKVLAKKAISRGCVDPYTLQYSRIPTYIRHISRKKKVFGDGCDLAVKTDHSTLLSIRMIGHQSQLRFKTDVDKCIRITIDNQVYFPKLYDTSPNQPVTVNSQTLDFIRNIAISKNDYRHYVHKVNPRDVKGNYTNVPYFFWLYQLLKELDVGILSDWTTPKMWAWIESLGFIEDRKHPLNTIKRPYITSYLGLQQQGHNGKKYST
jgi:hypothetical protein